MANNRLIERTIVLPVSDNDGVSLSDVHAKLQAALLAIAGGYSQHEANGAWASDSGQTFIDHNIVYTVLVAPSVDSAIAHILPDVCRDARQEALLTYTRYVDADFIQSAEAAS